MGLKNARLPYSPKCILIAAYFSVKSMDSNYYDSHFLAIKRVTDVSYGNIAENQNTTKSISKLGLTWWGDIVKVVVIVIILIVFLIIY